MELELFDMHCHMDFLADPAGFARAARTRGMAFFCNTVTPDGFLAARASLAGCDNVRVGVGAHPWQVHDGRCGAEDIRRACDLAARTRYIGEVGLDFGKRCASSRDAQVAAFEAIAATCAREGGKLMSVHAVHAADAALDVLERTGCLRNNQVVFHWFSDSNPALWRAIRAGCSFSVSLRMLSTRRGREYAKLIPVDRFLLETDLPPEDAVDFTLDAWEADLRQALAAAEHACARSVRAAAAANSRALLDV